MKRRISNTCLTLAAASWLASAHAFAKELDQFTDRQLIFAYYAGGYRQIPGAPGPAQVDAVLDARMNQLLDALQTELAGNPQPTAAERARAVRTVFQHAYLPALVTPYEEWVKHDAPVPLYKVRDKGIYGQAVDYDDMRLTWYIELSPIVQVNGVLIGIDKLGHFLAQGWAYYEHFEALGPLARSARFDAIRALGHEQERGQLGIATGGVYSYADLAANWAGMEFFLALFEDAGIEGDLHARYFARAPGGGWHRVRDFHWAEWVSPDWDEVLNPASVEKRALFDKVSANLERHPGPPQAPRPSICDHYRADPNAFLGPKQSVRPRAAYSLPQRGADVAPYVLDVRERCSRR